MLAGQMKLHVLKLAAAAGYPKEKQRGDKKLGCNFFLELVNDPK
jgi:hypothetical protein